MTPEHVAVDLRELEERVDQARKRGEIRSLLEIAGQAMDVLEATAADGNEPLSAHQFDALNTARRIGYNAAADAWPGWEIGKPLPSDADLEVAQTLAQRSRALVERLNLRTIARGNAIWLIGAFDLARGRRREALAAFREAAAFYSDAPAARLLSEGYAAIAAEASGSESAAASSELESILAQLDALSSEDAKEFRTQLLVARQVFNCR